MSLGPFAGITGSLKALRDIFPASTDTKINRLDATISSRLSETLGARQIELNAVKAKTDTIDQAALVTAITGATRGANMFLSTQNWTVPAGTTLIYITAQAGGGGGGSSGGGGSGGGAFDDREVGGVQSFHFLNDDALYDAMMMPVSSQMSPPQASSNNCRRLLPI